MKTMALVKGGEGGERRRAETTGVFNRQEPMSRSMQLNYIPVTAFS